MIVLSDEDAEALRRVMDETPAMTLSTADDKGAPYATPVYFAVDAGLRLLFLSSNRSAHAAHLARRADAAAALYPAVDDWRAIRGVQLNGLVECIGSAEGCAEFAIFARRFPFAAQVASQAPGSLLYRLDPTWIRLIDNRRGFGFQQEWRAE